MNVDMRQDRREPFGSGLSTLSKGFSFPKRSSGTGVNKQDNKIFFLIDSYNLFIFAICDLKQILVIL